MKRDREGGFPETEFQAFVGVLMNRYERRTKALREWAAELSGGDGVTIANRFGWAASVIENAGEAKVLQVVLYAVADMVRADMAEEAIFEHLYQMVLREVVHVAHFPSRSTSPVSDMTASAEGVGWASVLETIESFRKEGER